MKFCFIINPKSGKERLDGLLRQLKVLLDRDALSYEFRITAKPGHAIALAEESASSKRFDRIVAVGGDGSINEVVNGMMKVYTRYKDRFSNYPTLGIIPVGLGNDTARGLKIPRGLKDAYIIATTGQPNYIDIGEINGRFFINGAGVGYDGAVIGEMSEIRKKGKVLSEWIYLKVLMHQLWRFKAPLLKIETNDKSLPPRRYFLALAANGTGFGGIFKLAPTARMDDGLLDVLLVEDIPKHTFLFNVFKATRGKHITLKQVHYYTSEKIIIKSHTSVPCHIDGEYYYNNEFHIRLFPKILKVASPG